MRTQAPEAPPDKQANSLGLINRLVGLLKKKEIADVDINSTDAALLHRKQIQSKAFLRSFYSDMYDIFVHETRTLAQAPGKILELGSGAGFLKERIPDVITSDVVPMPFVDRVILADQLPFETGELKAILALNVLHHLTNAEGFFREADRTLKTGGRIVLIEPHCSGWGRFVYTYLHYEPIDVHAPDWKVKDYGRLQSANVALASLIFVRDRAKFEALFPRFRIYAPTYHTVVTYILSGGVSWPALAPAVSYPFFRWFDRQLSQATGLFPMFQTIVLEKT